MPDAPATPSVEVISHLYPQRPRPQLGIFVSEQVRALVALGSPPAGVVVPVPAAPWPLPLLTRRWAEYAACEAHRDDFGSVPVDFPRYLATPRRLMPGVAAASALRAIRRDGALVERLRSADAIVAHTALLDGAVGRSLAHSFGVPYAVVVHGEDLNAHLRADAPSRTRDMVSAVLSDADTVIAVSAAVQRGLRDALPDLRRVRVLHNGVDTNAFAPTAGAERERPAGAALRTLSACRLVASKGNDYVLRAIATLIEGGVALEHTIAGDGPERSHLQSMADALGIAERVRFVGAYAHQDLPALMRETDLFLLPGWDEAFGVVYLEAMACGVPVVAASDGGAPEIVDDGVDGFLVPPRDMAAVADAIRVFAAAPAEVRARMRAAARAKAESFTWEHNARGLLGIVSEILA